MKRKTIFLLLVFLLPLGLRAQRYCCIADIETRVPLRDAIVRTNTNHWARTDYRGYWNMPYAFDSVTVSKTGYVPRTVRNAELPDTLFLLPEAHQLGTVEVWGKNQASIRAMEERVKDAVAKEPVGEPLISFDVANMLDKRGRRDRKHRKKAHEIFNEMERSDDPIVDAYEEATDKDSK